MSATAKGEDFKRAEAERAVYAEVEAELREMAADLGDAELAALGRRRLDAYWPGWDEPLVVEWHEPKRGRVARRVEIRPAAG